MWIAGLLLAAFAVGAAAMPQNKGQSTGLGTLGGQVLAPNGKPVEGARLMLQSSDGTFPETTKTNAQGRYWFARLPKGLYDIRAYSNGRESEWRKNVWVNQGRQTIVVLRLLPKKRAVSAPPPASLQQ
jgi:hypothetical protein